jgi:hypothetical protein
MSVFGSFFCPPPCPAPRPSTTEVPSWEDKAVDKSGGQIVEAEALPLVERKRFSHDSQTTRASLLLW